MRAPRYGYLLSALRSMGWGYVVLLVTYPWPIDGTPRGHSELWEVGCVLAAILAAATSAAMFLRRPWALARGVLAGLLVTVSGWTMVFYMPWWPFSLIGPAFAGLVALPLVCRQRTHTPNWGWAAALGGMGIVVSIEVLATVPGLTPDLGHAVPVDTMHALGALLGVVLAAYLPERMARRQVELPPPPDAGHQDPLGGLHPVRSAPRYGYLLAALRSIGWGCLLVSVVEIPPWPLHWQPTSLVLWFIGPATAISAAWTLRRPATLVWGLVAGGALFGGFMLGTEYQDTAAVLLAVPGMLLYGSPFPLMLAALVLLPLVCRRPTCRPWRWAALLSAGGLAAWTGTIAPMQVGITGGCLLLPAFVGSALGAYVPTWRQAGRQAPEPQEGVG